MSVFDEYKASEQVSSDWRDLAQRVREVLDSAGVPNHAADDFPRLAGAEIEVDFGGDEAGGVFVDWRPGAGLADAVRDATRAGDVDAPAVRMFMVIATSMRNAILEILSASDFDAVAIDDYALRPPAIHVIGDRFLDPNVPEPR